MPLPPLRFDGPDDAETDFAFAHGAGIGWESDFMNAFASGLGSRGLRVVRFEFPNMQQMSRGSSRRPPDRMPLLLEENVYSRHTIPAYTISVIMYRQSHEIFPTKHSGPAPSRVKNSVICDSSFQ